MRISQLVRVTIEFLTFLSIHENIFSQFWISIEKIFTSSCQLVCQRQIYLIIFSPNHWSAFYSSLGNRYGGIKVTFGVYFRLSALVNFYVYVKLYFSVYVGT